MKETWKLLEPYLKNPLTNLLSEIGEEFKQIINNKIIEYQVEEYNRNYYVKTLLHRVTPKKLLDFYVPLRIINTKDYKRLDTQSVSKVFENHQFITIIGTAGSGKSTLIKYLLINSVTEKFKIPIKIELRYLNDFEGSIKDYVISEIFKISKIAQHDRIIERLLSSDKFIFFLDGYDEIKSSKKHLVTKDIDNFVKVYNKNYFLLSSRPYTNIELLPLFHNYEVSPLNETEIQIFIKKQIPEKEAELSKKILAAINIKGNSTFKEYLKNPLLLSMFILTFQSNAEIPQRRSLYYRQVFDTLFSLHDSLSKLAYVREKQSGLSKEKFEYVISLISFISYFEEKIFFNTEYLNKLLSKIKTVDAELNFDNNKIIDDFQVAIGILVKEGADYTFPHRSLQEYFAALYIFNLDIKNKIALYKKLQIKLFDKKSHEVSHFFNILEEIDFLYYIEYLQIPYLELLKVEASKNHDKPFDFFDKIANSNIPFHPILLKQTGFAFEYINKINGLYSSINWLYQEADSQNVYYSDGHIEGQLQQAILDTNSDIAKEQEKSSEKLNEVLKSLDDTINLLKEKLDNKSSSNQAIIDLI